LVSQETRSRDGNVNSEGNLERSLRIHLYPVLGHRPLHEIRRSHIQSWIKGLDHLSPRTVRIAYGHASMLFNAAVIDRAIGASPCVGIKVPEVVRDERAILTPK
jgi:hypothetical protein